MMIASKGAVWTAAVVLLASAATGGYLGYSRAAATPGGSADTDAYDVTPLAAKQASPINNAAPPIDEDYIRKIAHDEAETILHPPPKKVATAAAGDDNSVDSSDDSSPGANPPTPPPAAVSTPPVAAAAKPPPPPTGLY